MRPSTEQIRGPPTPRLSYSQEHSMWALQVRIVCPPCPETSLGSHCAQDHVRPFLPILSLIPLWPWLSAPLSPASAPGQARPLLPPSHTCLGSFLPLHWLHKRTLESDGHGPITTVTLGSQFFLFLSLFLQYIKEWG